MIRAIKAGYCSFKEVNSGEVSMEDIWVMNDWLDLSESIEMRIQKELEEHSK